METVDMSGPPAGVWAGAIDRDLFLVRGRDLAVIVHDFRCYSVGLRFQLSVVARLPDDQLAAALRPGSGVPMLRVALANENGLELSTYPDRALANGYTVMLLEGGGGGTEWAFECWLAPLPVGNVVFHWNWPVRSVGGAATLEAEAIQNGADRSFRLWPPQ